MTTVCAGHISRKTIEDMSFQLSNVRHMKRQSGLSKTDNGGVRMGTRHRIQDGMAGLLDSFETISLDQMDNVKLMDRIDTKYVMTFDQLLDVLRNLSAHYKVLMIEGRKKNSYQTIYFDTPDFTMFNNHHNGLVNRYKVRTREYLDSGLSFTEVKFKDNKKKTIKKRIETDIGTSLNLKSKKFVENKSSFIGDELVYTLKNTYSRLTFVHKENHERLTIDFDLVCYDNRGNNMKFDNIVIAEIKQAKLSNSSDFMKLMHEMHIRPRSFSKYCMGVSFLYGDVKKNNFKENMLFVDKLSGDVVA